MMICVFSDVLHYRYLAHVIHVFARPLSSPPISPPTSTLSGHVNYPCPNIPPLALCDCSWVDGDLVRDGGNPAGISLHFK